MVQISLTKYSYVKCISVESKVVYNTKSSILNSEKPLVYYVVINTSFPTPQLFVLQRLSPNNSFPVPCTTVLHFSMTVLGKPKENVLI